VIPVAVKHPETKQKALGYIPLTGEGKERVLAPAIQRGL